MAECIIRKSNLSGIIRVPPSKSHSVRAVLLGSLCDGKTHLRNILASPDIDAMIQACTYLGATIVRHDRGAVTVDGTAGNLQVPDDVINAGNSGLILRLIGAVAALIDGYTVITGDDSIRHRRPVQPLLSALKGLGAFAESSRQDGHAPIIVKGPLIPGATEIEAHDSQLLTGLLIAAAFAEGQTDITLKAIGEIPWAEMTLSWLEFLGVNVKNDNFERIHVMGRKTYPAFDYSIPADFSSAVFPVAAALVTNSAVTLTHLDWNDSQGDKGAIGLLGEMGANIETDEEAQTIVIKKHAQLKGREIDINPFIDAITILPVIACFAQGETHIMNGAVARHKECDRIGAMVSELTKMGAKIVETDDGMIIQPSELTGTTLDGHNDHRVVMSLAVAALGASGATKIKGIECVKKSYPDFFNHLRFLGADISVDLT